MLMELTEAREKGNVGLILAPNLVQTNLRAYLTSRRRHQGANASHGVWLGYLHVMVSSDTCRIGEIVMTTWLWLRFRVTSGTHVSAGFPGPGLLLPVLLPRSAQPEKLDCDQDRCMHI